MSTVASTLAIDNVGQGIIAEKIAEGKEKVKELRGINHTSWIYATGH